LSSLFLMYSSNRKNPEPIKSQLEKGPPFSP